MLPIPFLEEAVTKLFKPEVYGDSFDRLHYVVTSFIIGFFSIMISAKQYFGSPIKCWTYKEFSEGWDEYTEDYCFIENTYYHPINASFTTNKNVRMEKEINYYQWVPIILIIQALCFYFPNFIWKYCHKKCFVDFDGIIEEACKLKKLCWKKKKEETLKLANYLYDCFDVLKNNSYDYKSTFRRRIKGSSLTLSYIFIKILYITNTFIQLYVMNVLIGNRNHLWGFKMLVEMIDGKETVASRIFPRVTFCDFLIRRMGNNHPYTVQCVLMINIFNEKIFLFLWFWFVFVVIVSIINIIYIIIFYVTKINKKKIIKKFIKCKENLKYNLYFDDFCLKVLQTDGILLINLIESHAGSVISEDIAIQMFKNFLYSINNNEKNFDVNTNII
uniref:Innexin n=1 Tax=Parastrongyloides trichosuri TaxID=131310 RepID=A0A0N4ZRI2_PARTI